MLNHTSGLVGMALRGGRWVLPWLCVLALSASIAYATMLALGGAAPASPATTTGSAAEASTRAPATVSSTGSESRVSAETTCARYFGGNPTDAAVPELTAPPAWCRQ